MSVILWALIAIFLIFFIIIGSRITANYKSNVKNKAKAPKEKKPNDKIEKKKDKASQENAVENVDEHKADNETKNKEEKKKKNKKKEKYKNEFVRPSDIAWAELKEKQKRQAELKANKMAEEAVKNTLLEGESDNPNFTEPDEDWDAEDDVVQTSSGVEQVNKSEKDSVDIDNSSDMSEEIKNLSPEMKALLFGDVLNKKTKL